MDAATMKNSLVETVQALPEDAPVEDAMERLLFLAKLERGLREADGTATIAHSDIKKRFLKLSRFVGRRRRQMIFRRYMTS